MGDLFDDTDGLRCIDRAFFRVGLYSRLEWLRLPLFGWVATGLRLCRDETEFLSAFCRFFREIPCLLLDTHLCGEMSAGELYFSSDMNLTCEHSSNFSSGCLWNEKLLKTYFGDFLSNFSGVEF